MLSSTSVWVGMLGIAPAFCTHSVAAEAAKRSASSDDCEFRRATANAAVKQSPAPVVSNTFAAGTACCRIIPDSALNKERCTFWSLDIFDGNLVAHGDSTAGPRRFEHTQMY